LTSFAGLPDSIFSNQIASLEKILKCLAMKVVGKFYRHLIYFPAIWYVYGRLVYFVAIWYVLWPLGVFFPFRYVLPRKIWQPRSLALISKLH
jgi:hypothetical protein